MEIDAVAPVILLKPAQAVRFPDGFGEVLGGVKFGFGHQGLGFEQLRPGSRFEECFPVVPGRIEHALHPVGQIVGTRPDRPSRIDGINQPLLYRAVYQANRILNAIRVVWRG